VVFLISFSLTSGLHAVGLPFQFAFLLAYLVAVTVHLQLHRVFTFAGDGEYVLVRRNQAVRFVAVVVGQYAFIALSVAVFAPLLEVPDLVVYLGAIAVMSLANYLALAAKVFHTHRA
jgi:putative flippase GtrA